MMRFASLIVLAGLFISASPVLAQEGESVLRLPRPSAPNDDFASKGIRLSLAKPLLSSVIVAKKKDTGASLATSPATAEAASPAISIALGYAYLPIRRIGWTAEVGGSTPDRGLDNQSSLRVAANIAAALNSHLYLKSGVNLTQLSGEIKVNDVATLMEPRLGFQTGLGYQLNAKFGLEANYLWYHQAGANNVELFQQGAELGISGTF